MGALLTVLASESLIPLDYKYYFFLFLYSGPIKKSRDVIFLTFISNYIFVVTFGVTLDDFFIRMPRTVREAEGWSLVNSDCLDGTG